MAEVCIKVEVPEELRERFEIALDRVTRQFIRRVEFSIADEMLSKSKLTDEQVSELANKVKREVAKKHGL